MKHSLENFSFGISKIQKILDIVLTIKMIIEEVFNIRLSKNERGKMFTSRDNKVKKSINKSPNDLLLQHCKEWLMFRIYQ